MTYANSRPGPASSACPAPGEVTLLCPKHPGRVPGGSGQPCHPKPSKITKTSQSYVYPPTPPAFPLETPVKAMPSVFPLSCPLPPDPLAIPPHARCGPASRTQEHSELCFPVVATPD